MFSHKNLALWNTVGIACKSKRWSRIHVITDPVFKHKHLQEPARLVTISNLLVRFKQFWKKHINIIHTKLVLNKHYSYKIWADIWGNDHDIKLVQVMAQGLVETLSRCVRGVAYLTFNIQSITTTRCIQKIPIINELPCTLQLWVHFVHLFKIGCPKRLLSQPMLSQQVCCSDIQCT